jgi:hypothetical protein
MPSYLEFPTSDGRAQRAFATIATMSGAFTSIAGVNTVPKRTSTGQDARRCRKRTWSRVSAAGANNRGRRERIGTPVGSESLRCRSRRRPHTTLKWTNYVLCRLERL